MLLPAQAASLLSLPVNRMEEEKKKEEVGLLKKGSLTTVHVQWCSCLLGVFFMHSISCPSLVMAVRLQGYLTIVLAHNLPL